MLFHIIAQIAHIVYIATTVKRFFLNYFLRNFFFATFLTIRLEWWDRCGQVVLELWFYLSFDHVIKLVIFLLVVDVFKNGSWFLNDMLFYLLVDEFRPEIDFEGGL